MRAFLSDRMVGWGAGRRSLYALAAAPAVLALAVFFTVRVFALFIWDGRLPPGLERPPEKADPVGDKIRADLRGATIH